MPNFNGEKFKYWVCSEYGLLWILCRLYCSFGKIWNTWEERLEKTFGMDSLMWKSAVFTLVSFHLDDEVHKMLWLRKELELFGIDKIAKLIFYLNNKFNNIKAIEAMVWKRRFEGNWSLLSCSEIASNNWKYVFFDFIISLKWESVLLISVLLPESNLISWLELLWNQVSSRIKIEMALEVSNWHIDKLISKMLSINASAEAHMIAWLNHLWQMHGCLSREKSLTQSSCQHL